MPVPWVTWLIWLWVNAALACALVVAVFAIIAYPIKLIGKALGAIIEKCDKSEILSIVPWLVLFVILTILFSIGLSYLI